ncbi:uncharacterized protein BDZ83DRAFT_3483 [Colletotrichum acutatum]|uniref:Uncharacterized protein n=1 Tax=Glomerella acutata TaxID=27357 RepID=A0AAD8XQT7_GLOAC|nr:uncharacterized protein BDZ83DRAFT_3483 [Colletotrichum acutatum]KAK1731763.1 hypothetical protein BDZ83DRAFT_3483 [Colletotrichum acutatum]
MLVICISGTTLIYTIFLSFICALARRMRQRGFCNCNTRVRMEGWSEVAIDISRRGCCCCLFPALDRLAMAMNCSHLASEGSGSSHVERRFATTRKAFGEMSAG